MVVILVLILEFAFLAVINAGLSTDGRFVVDLLCILVFTVALLISIGRSKRLRAVRLPLVVGYFWRVALLFWDIFGRNIYGLPNSGADSEGFYSDAVDFAETGISTYGGLFSKSIGFLYRCTGVSRLYGQFMVVLSSMLTLCLIYFILDEFDISEEIKAKTTGIFAVLPNYAILSSIFLRESFITMFLAISLLCFVKWMNGKSRGLFLAAFAAALVASVFHSGSAAVAIGYIAVLLLYDRESRSFRIQWTNVAAALILAAVVVFLYINYTDVLFGKMANLRSIEDINANLAVGGSTYAQYVGDSSTPLHMLIYTIPRMVYYMFSPFPWQWRGLRDMIAFVFSSCVYFLIIWRLFRYLRQQKTGGNRYALLAFLIVLLCTWFVFAWGVTNVGTAVRHRDKMIALFAAMYALTYPTSRRFTVKWGRKEIL